MRRRERLVQVDMQHVDPEVSRPRHTHHGIQIGAVHIDKSAVGVDDLGNLGDIAFENAQSVRDW